MIGEDNIYEKKVASGLVRKIIILN